MENYKDKYLKYKAKYLRARNIQVEDIKDPIFLTINQESLKLKKLLFQLLLEYYLIIKDFSKTKAQAFINGDYYGGSRFRRRFYREEYDRDELEGYEFDRDDYERDEFDGYEFDRDDFDRDKFEDLVYSESFSYSNEEIFTEEKIKIIYNYYLNNLKEEQKNDIKKFLVKYLEKVRGLCESFKTNIGRSIYDSRNFSIYKLIKILHFNEIKDIYLLGVYDKKIDHIAGHIFLIKHKLSNRKYSIEFIGIQQSLLLFKYSICNNRKFQISKRFFDFLLKQSFVNKAFLTYAYAYDKISEILVKFYGFSKSEVTIKKYDKTKKEYYYEPITDLKTYSEYYEPKDIYYNFTFKASENYLKENPYST